MSEMFEVQSGNLAAKKAEHEDVQDFGEEMVEDHSGTTKDLKGLVKDEDIKATFPTALDEPHKAKLDELNSASGAAFDKVYVPMQVAAHEKAVSLFEAYAKSGDNEALKNWAGDTLPTEGTFEGRQGPEHGDRQARQDSRSGQRGVGRQGHGRQGDGRKGDRRDRHQRHRRPGHGRKAHAACF